MKSNFLDDLVGQHKKIIPISSLRSDFIKSLLVTLIYCAFVVYWMGFRDDLNVVFKGFFFNIEGLILLSSAVLGIFVSLISVRPGLLDLKPFKKVPSILFILIGILIFFWILKFVSTPSVQVFNLEYGKARMIEVIMIIFVPLSWLIWNTRKGMLLRPKLTFAALSLTMGALSTLCLHLGCCPFYPAQVLVWHFLPAVCISGLVVLMSRRI